MKHQFKLFCLVAAGLVALSGCGGGGGGSTPASTLVDLGGTAAKGILIGADVAAYAVVDGKQATTALATAKTDASGKYTLKLPVTTGPVIVEVRANSDTKMLDETVLDGEAFKEVDAPLGLTMRSFAPSVEATRTVRVNPYTEMAVAVASNIAGGFTTNSLTAGEELARLAAPSGVDPFTQIPASKPVDMDESQLKFAMQMAGLLSAVDTSCNLSCQIESLSKDIKLELNAEGRAPIPGTVNLAIQQQKEKLLVSGSSAVKVSSGQTNILTLNSPGF